MPAPHGLRVLLDGPLVRPLERQPPPLQVLAHPHLGQPHPVQLRDQVTDQPPRPQLPAQPHVAGPVIKDRLPHGGLLGVPEHLTHPDRPTARLHDQRLPPADLPLRPPDVDRLQRHPQHRRHVLTAPPRHPTRPPPATAAPRAPTATDAARPPPDCSHPAQRPRMTSDSDQHDARVAGVRRKSGGCGWLTAVVLAKITDFAREFDASCPSCGPNCSDGPSTRSGLLADAGTWWCRRSLPHR